MIDAREIFLIDGTGLFEASHRAFLGIPLLVVDAEDHTFLFGLIRDLLQLRRSFGIDKCLFVIGGEAHTIAGSTNVERAVTFLKQLGVAVIHDPLARVLDLVLRFTSLATCLVTHDRRFLSFAAKGRRIILLKDGSESVVYGFDTVVSKFGVTPDCVPAFLALTDGPRLTILTKREALAVLQEPGDLIAKIADPSIIPSRDIRKKVTANSAVILQRLKQLSPSDCCSGIPVDRKDLELHIDNERNGQLLAAHGFHSLRRLLPRPAKVNIVIEQTPRRPRDYHAITRYEDLQRLVTVLSMSKCCALDTEASGKDPNSAELFGVSISVRKGEAFYIPTIAHDLNGVDRDAIVSVLRQLLGGAIKVMGHNLKYDYVLLRRNGITIANIDFDTMLAAYDCFGDADVLNLRYLAERHLGKTIKSHGEIVSANQSLLDLPFADVVDYACDHAEVTLQLADSLQRELAQREIEQQYRDETVTMVKTLGDWEVDGIQVDLRGLCSIRDSLAAHVSRAKDAAVAEVGCRFNLDSEKEVAGVLRMNPIVAKVVGFRKVGLGMLEELAIAHKVARLLVRYNRGQKRLRDIESVIQSVRNGRVHPAFSQTRTDHCRLSSFKPRLLDVDNLQEFVSCLPHELRQFCPDSGRALGILADAASDHVLQGDILAAQRSYCLPNVPPLSEGDHLRLLLSVVVGVSDHQMCRIFLLDRNAVAAIRHDFRIRYSLTFLWLEQFCNETATKGFASAQGRRRYIDGLRSSNLEKRDKAMHSAVKWLIRW
jgi:DNA polymerase-1